MRGKGATIAELDCANVWVAGGEPDSWDVDDMVDKLDVLEALIPVEPAASIRGSDMLPGKYRSSSTTYHPKRLRRAFNEIHAKGRTSIAAPGFITRTISCGGDWMMSCYPSISSLNDIPPAMRPTDMTITHHEKLLPIQNLRERSHFIFRHAACNTLDHPA